MRAASQGSIVARPSAQAHAPRRGRALAHPLPFAIKPVEELRLAQLRGLPQTDRLQPPAFAIIEGEGAHQALLEALLAKQSAGAIETEPFGRLRAEWPRAGDLRGRALRRGRRALHHGLSGRLGHRLGDGCHIGGLSLRADSPVLLPPLVPYTAASMVLLESAHHRARIGVGVLVRQGSGQMRRGGAADDARAAFQRAERRPAPALLVEMALENHLAPRCLITLGDPTLGSPLAARVQEGRSLGVEPTEQMPRTGAAKRVDCLHEPFFLRAHAPAIRCRRQRAGDGQRAVLILLNFRFHASVGQVPMTKVQI